MGIPMGMGMGWVWELKFNPHGSPENTVLPVTSCKLLVLFSNQTYILGLLDISLLRQFATWTFRTFRRFPIYLIIIIIITLFIPFT